jgi:phage shock protein C
MYCTKCGVKQEESAAYCSQCGTPTGVRPAMSSDTAPPRLTRSLYDSKIAGVCGGLAQYLAVDSTLVRLVWLVGIVCFPPVLLGYIAAWIVMPMEAPRLSPSFGSGIPEPQQ